MNGSEIYVNELWNTSTTPAAEAIEEEDHNPEDLEGDDNEPCIRLRERENPLQHMMVRLSGIAGQTINPAIIPFAVL